MSEDLVAKLMLGEETAWSSFFLNVRAAKDLAGLPADQAAGLLHAGANWAGTGWTTTRASKAVEELTGLALVSAAVAEYRDAWLYACALLWSVEMADAINLSVRAGEVAFALYHVIGEKEKEPR